MTSRIKAASSCGTSAVSASAAEVSQEASQDEADVPPAEQAKQGMLARIKNAATCSATSAVSGEHEQQEGAEHDAANRDGLTLSQRLSCYGMRNNKTSAKGAEGTSEDGDSEGVIHGAVKTVMDKLQTDHAASVVAINGQELTAYDLEQLMLALAESWQRDGKSKGALSSVRKLYLGRDNIGDDGASSIAESLKGPCQVGHCPISIIYLPPHPLFQPTSSLPVSTEREPAVRVRVG